MSANLREAREAQFYGQDDTVALYISTTLTFLVFLFFSVRFSVRFYGFNEELFLCLFPSFATSKPFRNCIGVGGGEGGEGPETNINFFCVFTRLAT